MYKILSNLPYSHKRLPIVVYDNKIHIFGSDNDSSYYKAHYSWDGTQWVSESTLPVSFTSGAVVVYNNKIHILSSTSHYSWDGTSWSQESTMPYTFQGGSAVVYNNKIHLLGGNWSSSSYTRHISWNGTSWANESTLPYNFYQGAAVVYNNKIHILGGNDTNARLKHYSWDGSTWSAKTAIPLVNNEFSSCPAVVYNNKIHIFGSYYTTHERKEHYSWDDISWEEEIFSPYPAFCSSSVVYNNMIHILGGDDNSYAGKLTKYHYQYSSDEYSPNKIIYGEDTKIDLTEDDITIDDVLNFKTFHMPNGDILKGYRSYSNVTPSSSGAYFSSGLINMSQSGYAYLSRPTVAKTGSLNTPTTANTQFTISTGLSSITELWLFGNCNVSTYKDKILEFIRYKSSYGNNYYAAGGYSSGYGGYAAFGSTLARCFSIQSISGGTVTMKTATANANWANMHIEWIAF